MNILYVLSQYPKLSETFVQREIALMRQLGHTVNVFSFLPPAPEEVELLRSDGEDFSRIEVGPGRIRCALQGWVYGNPPNGARPECVTSLRETLTERAALGALGPAAARMAKRCGAEWIHAHFASIAATGAWSAAHHSGLPFSFTIHAHGIFHRKNPYLGAKIQAAALTVTVSEYNRRFIANRLGQKTADRIEIVRCGLNMAQFDPPSAPRDIDIVSVGRLVEYKGYDVLFDALSRLPKPRPQCEIVGDGPDRAQLQRQIAKLGLSDSVRLRGSLPNAETRALIARARVFALACRAARDGARDSLPVALMEALALETPAVSTRFVGIPELVEDGKTGLLAEPGDPNSLASALQEILADSAMRERLGKAGRRRIEKEYDIEKNVTRLSNLIASRAQ